MRRELTALLILLAILVGASLLWVMVLDPAATPEVTVLSVAGQVAHDRGSGSEAATVGDILQVSDHIHTGSDGRAVLGFGTDSQITLRPGAEVILSAIDAEGVQLKLEGGTVEATIRPGAGTLDIEATGRHISANDADFLVTLDNEDGLGVRTERGQVQVDQQTIGAGERLIALPNADPSIGPVSESLLLTVQWPPSRTRATEVPIKGQTEAGASVQIQSTQGTQTVKAGANGQFSAMVPLIEGQNALSITANGLMGGQAQSDQHLERDTTAPAVTVQIGEQRP